MMSVTVGRFFSSKISNILPPNWLCLMELRGGGGERKKKLPGLKKE